MEQAASAFGVAVIHTAFNVVAVILMFPVSWILEKMAYITLPVLPSEEAETEGSRAESKAFREQISRSRSYTRRHRPQDGRDQK